MAVLSPKTVFYLEHRAQIEEWTRLRKAAAREVHRWLASWAELVEEEAPGEGVCLFRELDGSSYPKLFWHHQGWMLEDASRPLVGIGFEWKKTAAHHPRGFYIGVWIDRTLAPEKYEALKKRLDEIVSFSDWREGEYQQNKSWAIYVYLKPIASIFQETEDPVTDPYEPVVIQEALAVYRAEQLERGKDLWREFAEDVDRSVEWVKREMALA